MPKFIINNPKAFVTALAALAAIPLRIYVFKDLMTPEMTMYIDIILVTMFGALIGRFTRMDKSDAILLEECKKEDNKNQILKPKS